jgi:hypothetical protein
MAVDGELSRRPGQAETELGDGPTECGKPETARRVSAREVQGDLAPTVGAAPAIDPGRPLPGFSGATPKEICARYAAGLISRDQLIDELGRFPYQEADTTDGDDWLTAVNPGSFG